MNLSLVSPVYNEAKNITEFVRRSAQVLSQLSDTFEIILVDDCSTDHTNSLLAELGKSIPQLQVFRLNKNSGQHAATVIGLQRSRGDFVFLMDSDLQAAPEDMQKLFAWGLQNETWDIVSGLRKQRSGSAMRMIGSKIVSCVINLITRTHLEDPGSTFLLFTRSALNRILQHDILAQNLQILMGFLKLRVIEIPVSYQVERVRKSSYRLSDLPELLIMALLNFTTGKTTLLMLLLVGLGLLCVSSIGIIVLILIGIIHQLPLRTNLLIFFMSSLVLGMQFLFMGIIAYKIERLNRNLDFRKSLIQECSDDP